MSPIGRHDCEALVVSTERRYRIPIFNSTVFDDRISLVGRHDCEALIVLTERRNCIPIFNSTVFSVMGCLLLVDMTMGVKTPKNLIYFTYLL